jgi:hypothetical protein
VSDAVQVRSAAGDGDPEGCRSGPPYTGEVEIRVHGVSGTPPEELLGRADVHQVAGDRLSGFYRPSLAQQMRDEPPPDAASGVTGRPGPWLEGYSWGGWTSGARSRVLWLLLLPFALVNVSSRMLPPEPPGRPQPARALRLTTAALIRVLALSLTLSIVQGAAGVAMVTVANRCASVPGQPGLCHGLPSWSTDLLGRLSPAARLLLGAAVPIAVTLLLWLVSYQASARYERASGTAPGDRPDDAAQPLLRPDLWRSGPVVSRLRLVHVQAGLVSVLGTASWLLPAGADRTVTVSLAAATLLGAALLVVLRPRPPYDLEHRARIMLPARVLWAPVAGTAAALAIQVAPQLAGPAGPVGAAVRAGADLAVRRADVLVQDLFVGQALLLALIALLVAAGRIFGACRGRAVFMSGFAAFFVGMLAWLLGAMLTAAVLILAPAWLARPGFAFTPRQIATALASPDTAGWFGDTSRSAGVGTAVGVAVLVLLVLQLGGRAIAATRTGGARRDREAVGADYPIGAGGGTAADRDRARRIGYIFWTARRVDGVPSGIVVLCAAIAGLLIVQGLALAVPGGPTGGWAAAMLGRTPPACRAAADTGLCSHVDAVAWGAFLTAGLAVLVVVAGVLAYRTPAARRGVGVFWDLACFWPRDTHPFAPPCYNERIMPQVSERVRWYLGTERHTGAADPSSKAALPPAVERGRLVLAGHSQGSVIALAAAVIQPAATRQRLSLVTVGCVLDRLYSRFFPRYFGPELYRTAAAMLSPGAGADDPSEACRWINIWRHSDYLGGSVPYPPGPDRVGPEDVESIDPPFDVASGDTVYPAARRHSDFWTDPVFLPQVERLLAETRAAAPAPGAEPAPDEPHPPGESDQPVGADA